MFVLHVRIKKEIKDWQESLYFVGPYKPEVHERLSTLLINNFKFIKKVSLISFIFSKNCFFKQYIYICFSKLIVMSALITFTLTVTKFCFYVRGYMFVLHLHVYKHFSSLFCSFVDNIYVKRIHTVFWAFNLEKF